MLLSRLSSSRPPSSLHARDPGVKMSNVRCRQCHRKKRTRHTHSEQSYEKTRPFPSWQSDVPPPSARFPLYQSVAPFVISTVPPRPPTPTAPPLPFHYPQMPTLAQAQSIVNTIHHIRHFSADLRQPKHEKALDMLQSLQFLCQNIMTKHNLRVDYLWELDPTHHGVNSCNIGQGQHIMVRLRNETNADFRTMEEIMDTMLHELAHNHYPEHDRHSCLVGSTPSE